jgi:hypothetical protein
MKLNRLKISAIVRPFAAFLFILFSLTSSAQVDSIEPPGEYYGESNDQSDNTPQEPDTIELRAVPAEKVNELKKDDDFWYADSAFNHERIKESTSTTTYHPQRRWLSLPMLVAILLLFMAIIVFFLFKSNVVAGRRSPIKTDEEELAETEDIFSINYQKEIDKAIRDKNYRLATRLLFLRLLKTMDEKHIIRYKQELTNFDYLMQVFQTGYYKDFFRLTRNYEYAWYGNFEVSEQTFSLIRNDYENFQQKLS